MPANVFLASATLHAGNGGISRVARLMARVLAEEMAAGRLTARAASFLDHDMANVSLPTMPSHASKARFTWEIHKAALSYSHFLYDSLAMTRAHCRLPLLRRSCLTWIHGIEVWDRIAPTYLRCARHADVLIANSAYTRERADRLHGGFQRAHVCWLGTETDDAPPLPAVGDRRPTVLILGRMDKSNYKGHSELLACWPKVVSAVPRARLLIVGKGPHENEIRQQAAVSPAADALVFKGFVPDDDMAGVWNEATVFAMPSRGEGFGLVYVEAMRQGLPVVASVHDAAPEINLDSSTGYNVDLDKPDQLPERIVFLLKNPQEAAILGRNGRNRWRECFAFGVFKQRFLPILRVFLSSTEHARSAPT